MTDTHCTDTPPFLPKERRIALSRPSVDADVFILILLIVYRRVEFTIREVHDPLKTRGKPFEESEAAFAKDLVVGEDGELFGSVEGKVRFVERVDKGENIGTAAGGGGVVEGTCVEV